MYNLYKLAFEEQRIKYSIWKKSTSESCPKHVSVDLFIVSAVGFVRLNPDLLIIWEFMTANNDKLILHRSFLSNSLVICVNSVTEYVHLQQVKEAIWKCTGLMSITKTGLLPIAYTAEIAKVQPRSHMYVTLCCIEEMAFFFKEMSHYIYIYIYIYTHTYIYIYIKHLLRMVMALR